VPDVRCQRLWLCKEAETCLTRVSVYFQGSRLWHMQPNVSEMMD